MASRVSSREGARLPALLLATCTASVTGPGVSIAAGIAGRRRAFSAGAVASVNDEMRTGHELRFIGGEVEDAVSYVLWATPWLPRAA